MANIMIEVAYADEKVQKIYTLTLPENSNARQAVQQSPIAQDFPQADLTAPIGIFGKKVKDETRLQTGDRVELYRPLIADAKEARRQRIQKKKNTTHEH